MVTLTPQENISAENVPGTEEKPQDGATLGQGNLPAVATTEDLLKDAAGARAELNDDFITLTSAPAADIDASLLVSPITPEALEQIAGWKPDAIKDTISADAIAGLQAQDFAGLPVSFINALSEKQVEAITPQQFGALPPETLSSVSGDILGLITPETLQSITVQQAQSLSIAHLENLTVEQLDILLDAPATAQVVQQKYAAPLLAGPLDEPSATLYADMAQSDVQTLFSASIIEKIPVETFATLPADFIQNFSAEQRQAIAPVQFAALPPDTLKEIDPETLSALPPALFGRLAREQVQALSTHQLNKLTVPQVEALPEQALGVLQERYSAALLKVPIPDSSLKEYAAMFEYDVRTMITPETIAKITATEFRALPTRFVSKFSDAQLAAITPDQFKQMTRETLQRLQPGQLAAVAPDALAGIREEQLQALKTAQIKGLTPEQLQVLVKLPGGKDIVQFAYAEGQIDAAEVRKQLSSGGTAADIRVVEIEKMTPAAIAALGEDIGSLSSAAVRALEREQIAAVTPEQVAKLNAAQIRALGERISALSNEAIDAIDIGTVASDTYALSLWRFGQKAQEIRTEKAPEIRDRLQARTVKDDISQANLEGVFLPVERGTDPSIGTFIHTSMRVRMQVKGPTGELERVPAALYRASKVDIPGVDSDEYKQRFNEFADEYARWQAFNHLVSSEISNSGVRGLHNIEQLTPAQQARIEPLLQARLDAALDARDKLETLQELLTEAGHDADRLARIKSNDTANEWRYIDFSPAVPAVEVQSSLNEELDKLLQDIEPPRPDPARPAPLP